MTFAATEQADLDTVRARLPELEAHVTKWIRRMAPYFTLEPPARVLDVGAAQGGTTIAFQRLGFQAAGVEPFPQALEVGRALAADLGLQVDVREGVAESLPFEDGSFRFVHAYSVMEHVDDPYAAWREAYRVLEPGGALFFSTTGKLAPVQSEIQGFPLFPWYPEPVQHRIMHWAVDNRPELVGHTTRPAMHWFRHREVRAALRGIGFTELVDMWNLRPSEENTGPKGLAVEAAKRWRAAKIAGALAIGGDMEYLAVK